MKSGKQHKTNITETKSNAEIQTLVQWSARDFCCQLIVTPMGRESLLSAFSLLPYSASEPCTLFEFIDIFRMLRNKIEEYKHIPLWTKFDGFLNVKYGACFKETNVFGERL